MKKETDIFKHLNNPESSEKARTELVSYIKSKIQHFELITEETFNAAYDLAGLMATDYVRTLSENDPIMSVLSLAGELEIAPADSVELAAELAYEINTL